MNRLFKLFLLVLFISPLFSSAANALCGQEVRFAYAPDWNDPTKVVEIIRYYNPSNKRWYYDATDCTKWTTGYVQIPLEGTFSNAIPFVFGTTNSAKSYVHNVSNLIDVKDTSSVTATGSITGTYSIACERSLEYANILTCEPLSTSFPFQMYSATFWAKNKSKSGRVLNDITYTTSRTFKVQYGNSVDARKLTPSTFQSFSGSRSTLTNVAFDTNNPGVVCGDPNCNTFVGSFSVVDPNMQNAGLTEVGYNQATSCTAGSIIKESTTIQRPAVYCDYNSAADTNPICRIDYTRVSFSAQPFFCSVGGIQLESPSPSDPILFQNPITTNTTVITVPTCFNTTVKLSDSIERSISYAPSTQKYYSSSNCRSGTEFKNNKILLELDASQTKIPVAFSNTSSESVSETTLSSWVPSISTFYCGYDSNNSSTQLVCNFTNPPTQDGLTFYPSAYATLDNRALTIGGTVAQRLIAYCNPLSFSGKTFYSKYDDDFALHWYSDNKCTSELTGDFPLQFNLSDTAAAVPIVFSPGTSGGSSSTLVDRTITNSGPIYCEYDSAVSGTALKCKYNSSGTTFLPGGELAAPNNTESYYPRLVAGFVDDKHLSVTNDIANATTTVTYTTNICNTINLKYQNDNSLNGLESKTLYWNGETWCKQSGCTDCGYSDKDVFTNTAGYYPAYFSLNTTQQAYQVLSSDKTNYTISDRNPAISTCGYENGELSCDISKDGNYSLIAYVFIAPNVAGAITDGELNNFSVTSASKTINIKYKPAKCSEYVNVHFYGFDGRGGYTEMPLSGRGTVKYYYEADSWYVNGNPITNFSGITNVISSIKNAVTVNNKTYDNGITAYRAAYIGGAPASTTPPDNIVIEKTTGIVEQTSNPYDIMITGNSLPTIPENKIYTVNGQVKDIYYRLLYAANCLDPDGSNTGSTCELEILPNGAAVYSNQCLPGHTDGNFGDNQLTNVAVSTQELVPSNSCIAD